MKISIAMATWMGEKYLDAQLQSFLDQTRLPDELVVRDDGSRDRTLAILEQFANHAPFPVHILPGGRRLGYAANFGAVLPHTTGELIFLSDQDDVWLPHRLETISQIAADNPDKLLFINNVENVDESLHGTGITKLENLQRAGLSDERYITGCATTIRRPLLDFALPFPEGLNAHDHWLHECGHWLRAREVIPAALQFYRRHDSNTSGMSISRPQPVNRLTSQVDTLKGDTLRSHRQLLLMACEIHARLMRTPDQATRLTHADLNSLLAALEMRIQALRGRVDILETGWPMRLPRALGFWIRGGYRNFFGWKSLVNDLLNRSHDT